jgi:DnaJ homolog subfamily A member 2
VGFIRFNQFDSTAELCSGDLKVIRDQGMPSLRHHEPGDLFVKFHVTFPDHLDASAVAKLEKALPPRKPVDKLPKGIVVEEVELLDLDARQQREQANHGEDGMEEDEEQPRVQCANQ